MWAIGCEKKLLENYAKQFVVGIGHVFAPSVYVKKKEDVIQIKHRQCDYVKLVTLVTNNCHENS